MDCKLGNGCSEPIMWMIDIKAMLEHELQYFLMSPICNNPKDFRIVFALRVDTNTISQKFGNCIIISCFASFKNGMIII